MTFADPDNRFVKEVFEQGEYKFLHHYDTVVDIGANVGAFALWMYDKADKIYCLEPAAENVETLNKTIELNALSKITVVQTAISNKSIVQMMKREGPARGGAWRIDSAGDLPVHCLTLKDYFDLAELDYVDLVKMDVEEHELAIIQTPLFPKDRIGTLFGEIHNVGRDGEAMKDTLEWMGFKYTNLPNSHFIARKI